jgi:hypothetical protein
MPQSSPNKSSDQDSPAKQYGALLSDIGGMMATPGADIEFLQKLQMVIAQKVQEMVHQAIPSPGGQPGGPPPGGGMGSPMPGPGGGPPGGPGLAGPPAGVNGVQQLAQPPNPDELRRLVGQGAGQ